MNKSIFKTAVAVAVAGAAVCLIGCGGGDNGVSGGGVDPAVAGTWIHRNDDGSTASLTFNRDGTCSLPGESATLRWKYTTDGTRLTITVNEIYHEETGKWMNREQYSAMIEEQIKKLEEQKKNADPNDPYYSMYETSINLLRTSKTLPFMPITFTHYSVNGNTLTLCMYNMDNCADYTKN